MLRSSNKILTGKVRIRIIGKNEYVRARPLTSKLEKPYPYYRIVQENCGQNFIV